MIRLLADENFDGRVTAGLLHRRPEIELVRVQEVGLDGVDDPGVLEWAAGDHRIVLTHDRNTMTGYANQRIAAGLPMPGLFVVDDHASVGRCIDDILLIDSITEHAEWADKLEFLPYPTR